MGPTADAVHPWIPFHFLYEFYPKRRSDVEGNIYIAQASCNSKCYPNQPGSECGCCGAWFSEQGKELIAAKLAEIGLTVHWIDEWPRKETKAKEYPASQIVEWPDCQACMMHGCDHLFFIDIVINGRGSNYICTKQDKTCPHGVSRRYKLHCSEE